MCRQELASAIDRSVFPGTQGGPFMQAIAAKAVAFKEALTPEFKDYQFQIVKNAGALADRLKENDFDLVSGGTDNHLMLVKLLKEGITGKEADETLERANITLNKNYAFCDQRHSDRHTMRDHQRNEGEGDGADRRSDNCRPQRHQE
jgi:glycine hydroxymethyltransferase